jgi:hypothetical protein
VCCGVCIVSHCLISSPSTRRDKWFLSQGRSPGSRVKAKVPAFPVSQWRPWHPLTAYSRGGGCGLGPPILDKPLPHSHFIPERFAPNRGTMLICCALLAPHASRRFPTYWRRFAQACHYLRGQGRDHGVGGQMPRTRAKTSVQRVPPKGKLNAKPV